MGIVNELEGLDGNDSALLRRPALPWMAGLHAQIQ